jgi:hypothetical protein
MGRNNNKTMPRLGHCSGVCVSWIGSLWGCFVKHCFTFSLPEGHFINNCNVPRQLRVPYRVPVFWAGSCRQCNNVQDSSGDLFTCLSRFPLGNVPLGWAGPSEDQLTSHAWHAGSTQVIWMWSWRWFIADHQVNGGLSRNNSLQNQCGAQERYRLTAISLAILTLKSQVQKQLGRQRSVRLWLKDSPGKKLAKPQCQQISPV